MINIKIDKSNKCNGEYSLYITFPYNPKIVEIMRAQIIRYWHPDTKEWELPLKSLERLKGELKGFDIDVVDSNDILSNLNFNRKDNNLYT